MEEAELQYLEPKRKVGLIVILTGMDEPPDLIERAHRYGDEGDKACPPAGHRAAKRH